MSYRDRRLAKADRYREWADKREQKAEADAARSKAISDMIPFGQPILEGHHSEKRHRADLDRVERGHRSALEHRRKADEFRRRADEIERQAKRSIYSDDDSAFARLEARIVEREAERDRKKAANAAIRRGGDWRQGLTDEDLTEAESNFAHWPGGTDVPFPNLSNLSATIRRDRKRLESLQ